MAEFFEKKGGGCAFAVATSSAVRALLLLFLVVAMAHGVGSGTSGRAGNGREDLRVPLETGVPVVRSVRVGIYRNPPKIFLDESGRPAGIFVEILGEIAKREKWKIVYVPGEWDQCLAALREGRIDLMPDVAYSHERDLLYDFHGTPVIESWSQIYGRKSDRFSGLATLQGRRVAVLRKSVQEVEFQRTMEGFGYHVRLVPVGTLDEAFQKVRDGSADVAIANHSAGEYLLGKYGLARTDIVFSPVSLFFATAQGRHADLLDAIDRRLDEGRRTPDSYYYKALAHWVQNAPVQVVPRLLVWSLISVALFLALAFFAILVLRRRVATRTRHLEVANASLRESEERFRSLYKELELVFSAMPEALLFTDMRRNIQKVNPAFVRIFGYESEDVVGRRTDFLYDSPQVFAEQGRMRSSDRADPSIEPYEVVYRKRDGGTFIGETVGGTIRSNGGPALGMLALVRDVTEHRRLEDDLAQARKMEAVGMLAGGVAHDINNTLSAIFGYCEIAMLKAGASSPLQQDLGEILAAAKRSRDITKRLLGFARKQSILPRILDFNMVIEGMLAMLRRLIGENVDVEWTPGVGSWLVKMDPSQIDQILTNLCVNARDAIADVGRVSIRTGNVILEDDASLEPGKVVSGAFVLLEIRDDGCGMERDVLDRIFEPFYTTKAVGIGTGLGLATVYGIVKQNNGFVRVASEPGKGSVFSVYIPRCEETLVSGDALSTPAGFPKGRGETILVVEDDGSILELARKILLDLGYHALIAGTPSEAIQLVETHRGMIHLLLSDVIMPGMNGKDLADRLVAARPGMRTIFMSGHCAETVKLEDGMRLVQKPFSIQELAESIHAELAVRK